MTESMMRSRVASSKGKPMSITSATPWVVVHNVNAAMSGSAGRSTPASMATVTDSRAIWNDSVAMGSSSPVAALRSSSGGNRNIVRNSSGSASARSM